MTTLELEGKFESIRLELLPQVNSMQSCCQQLQLQVLNKKALEFQEDVDAIDNALLNLLRVVDHLQDSSFLNRFEKSDNISLLESRLRHDLRTPLNAVKGYSEMLLDDLHGSEDSTLYSLFSSLLSQTDQILGTISNKVVFTLSEKNKTADTRQSANLTSTVGTNPTSEPGTILVVDDSESNRRLLLRSLTQQGHKVECANDGKDALAQLYAQNFDLVLLDMLMPEMDGLDVLSIIKKDAQLQHIPVIVISALDDFDRVIECIKAGAEDYLPKPFNATLLGARIGTGLEKKRLRDTTAALVNRMEEELQDAHRAQLNLVPHKFIDFSVEQPVAVHAYMKPAREVGGDFYDFFYMNSQYLWFLVGDVSDKGVASGMFMARASSLVRSIPMQAYKQAGKILLPHEVLYSLNIELCQFNPDMTFVTLLLGRLDIESGDVLFGNAGHSAAMLLTEGNVVEPLDTLRGRPLGIRTDSTYQSHASALESGQALFLYTDGVSDALDENGRDFGEDRLVETLNTLESHSAESILNTVNSQLTSYTANTDQFDDITMLALQWEGTRQNIEKEITLSNSLSDCSLARKEIATTLVDKGLSESTVDDLSICIDELLSNIVRHGFKNSEPHEITIKLRMDSTSTTLEIIDDGVPFDPTVKQAQEEKRGQAYTAEGGRGLTFVRALIDELTYQHIDERNHTVLTKRLANHENSNNV